MDNLVRRFRKWRERRRQIKTNKELCQRYPFLIPWHRFTGELSVDRSDWKHPRAIPPYDWSYTELDNMPEGWFKRFGIQMCEEIRDALIEDDDLERYRVVQLKEKYGSIRWFDTGTKIGSRVPMIIDKYSRLSERTCIHCGKPATQITLGWISPYCDDCCPEFGAIPIEEYFMEDEKKDDAGTDRST